MNAGGVDKACKSNGLNFELCAITSSGGICLDSGERVSNTLVTYLEVGDSPPKGGVIPDGIARLNPQGASRSA